MTLQRWSTTRQGVRGVLTVERVKGPRPEDQPGWDLYEEAKNVWAFEKFVQDAENRIGQKKEAKR